MFIEFKDVSFSYDGVHNVLAHVDVRIEEGEFVSIIGGNGSGKSTLAKHMNALLLPKEGSVCVGEFNTQDEAVLFNIRQEVGMVFQNPDDQMIASLVENDVAFGPENLGLPSEEIRHRVTRSLKSVGLAGFEKRETAQLSGGQKQRVALAGVLAMHPKCLILDEASAMLDPRGRRELIRICKKLNAQGMTIIFITHFMEEVAETTRSIMMQQGSIVYDGATKDLLLHEDALKQASLDVPFAVSFSRELINAGFPIQESILEDDVCQQITSVFEHGGVQNSSVKASGVQNNSIKSSTTHASGMQQVGA